MLSPWVLIGGTRPAILWGVLIAHRLPVVVVSWSGAMSWTVVAAVGLSVITTAGASGIVARLASDMVQEATIRLRSALLTLPGRVALALLVRAEADARGERVLRVVLVAAHRDGRADALLRLLPRRVHVRLLHEAVRRLDHLLRHQRVALLGVLLALVDLVLDGGNLTVELVSASSHMLLVCLMVLIRVGMV